MIYIVFRWLVVSCSPNYFEIFDAKASHWISQYIIYLSISRWYIPSFSVRWFGARWQVFTLDKQCSWCSHATSWFFQTQNIGLHPLPSHQLLEYKDPNVGFLIGSLQIWLLSLSKLFKIKLQSPQGKLCLSRVWSSRYPSLSAV